MRQYYLSSLNHSANEIVFGNFQKAYEMLLIAQNIVCQKVYLKNIHEDILLNNTTISAFFCKIYSAADCISILESVIDRISEAADYALIKNNIATFYALNGQFDIALSICFSPYQKIEFNDNQQQGQAASILSKAFSLNPLPKDQAYFKARAQKILLLIENISVESILNNKEWNCFLYKENPNIIGQAWKFWSSLLLLSELQIWSDF